MPTLSLCLIARDEEKNLARCLESVRELVDELIVVDTGSKDRTPEIARQLGAKVILAPWEDDFSKARNRGLAEVKGKWVLVLDADECLAAESRDAVRQAIASNHSAGINVIIKNLLAHDRLFQFQSNRFVRLFRASPAIRFEGRVHEQVLPSIRRLQGTVTDRDDIVIHHFGYSESGSGREPRQERNLRLLLQELQERPDDAFVHYNLGATYQSLGMVREATESLEKAVGLGDRGTVGPWDRRTENSQEGTTDQKSVNSEQLAVSGGTPPQADRLMGPWDRGTQNQRSEVRESVAHTPIPPHSHTSSPEPRTLNPEPSIPLSLDLRAKAHTRLAQLYLAQNRLEEAVQHCEWSVECGSTDPLTFFLTAVIHMHTYNFSTAANVLEWGLGLFDRQVPGALESGIRTEHLRMTLGHCKRLDGRPEEASLEFHACAQANPDNLDAWIGLGECETQTNRLSNARIAFQRALEIDPESETARRGLALCDRAVGESVIRDT